MNNQQRWVIVVDGDKVIGTDSGQAFTERAAHQKCALLQQARPKIIWKVVEITPLLSALG